MGGKVAVHSRSFPIGAWKKVASLRVAPGRAAPILSVVPAVLVALFMALATVVWVLLFFLAIQQLENNVLAPRISDHAVGLHPLGAMFALLAGFPLAGLLGGLFAVPLAGVLWVLLGAAYRNVVVGPRPRRPLFPVPRFRRPVRKVAQNV